MRMIGLALLLAAGCNQVFGIKDTQKQPDAADPMFIGHMNWVAPAAGGSGTVVFPIGGEAVDSAPLTLQIGSGAGSGADTLTSAPYDPSTGEFKLGFMLAGQAWRLVYNLPGDPITQEFQWNIQTPDLVIPRMTRKGATPVPTGSGYDITPTPAQTFTVPAVAVGGAFTWTYVPLAEFSGGRIQLTYADTAQPLLGPQSAPDPATDWILVTDAAAQTSDRTGVIGWSYIPPSPAVALTAGALTPSTPAWQTSPFVTIKPIPARSTAVTRMGSALKQLGNDDTGTPLAYYQHMTYGLAPSTAVYGFRPAPEDCGTKSADVKSEGLDCLTTPAVIPLVEDLAFDSAIQVPSIVDVPLTPVLYARVTQPRETHGVALVSNIQSMVVAPLPPTTNESIDVLSNNIATAVLVDQIKLDTSDLSGATGPASMDVAVSAGSQPRVLTFNPRLGQDGAIKARADDYVITLWQIQNPDSAAAKLHTVRLYHVLDAAHGVNIEGQLLQPGLYVFSITARVGFPNAVAGDYKATAYPLGESTVFSRQFRVQ